VPTADIRALLNPLLRERLPVDSCGHAAVAHSERDITAAPQRALVIASLLRCPGPSGRDADSSARRSW
jgi:hypothetical protein